jgi:protein-S-isoprenylcysteine O-methyltransferase Ste14
VPGRPESRYSSWASWPRRSPSSRFTGLLHGNRTYLVVASLLGVVATGAGVQMLVASSGAGLTVVVVAMVILWLTATVHHTLLANAQNVDGRSAVAPRRGEPTRTYAH